MEEVPTEEEEEAEDAKTTAEPQLSVTNAIRLVIFNMNVHLGTRKHTMPNWMKKKNYL